MFYTDSRPEIYGLNSIIMGKNFEGVDFQQNQSNRTEQEVSCFLKSIFLATRAMVGE